MVETQDVAQPKPNTTTGSGKDLTHYAPNGLPWKGGDLPAIKRGEHGAISPTGSARSVRTYMKQQTDGGKILVDYLVTVVKDITMAPKWRIYAVQILLEQGWGKPAQNVNLHDDRRPAVVLLPDPTSGHPGRVIQAGEVIEIPAVPVESGNDGSPDQPPPFTLRARP